MAGPTEYMTSASPPLKVSAPTRTAVLRPGNISDADSSPASIRHSETNTPRATRDDTPRRIRRCDNQAINRLKGVVTTTNITKIRPVCSGSMPRPTCR
ncbi:hypothetical protein D3C79_865060 [compost metagenome]